MSIWTNYIDKHRTECRIFFGIYWIGIGLWIILWPSQPLFANIIGAWLMLFSAFNLFFTLAPFIYVGFIGLLFGAFYFLIYMGILPIIANFNIAHLLMLLMGIFNLPVLYYTLVSYNKQIKNLKS